MKRIVLMMIGALLLAAVGLQAGPQGVVPRPPDDQVIETNIGEMLAGWQIGDTELMHKYYAEDVMVVSGAYEPPLIGWTRYAAAYQTQRQRMQNVQLERRNTFVKVKGSLAWATYQWEFRAVVDGNPTGAQGQATLLFEKRGDRWLIIHNHTSVVAQAQPQPPAPQPPAEKPAK